MIKLFAANKLVRNVDKSNIMKFVRKNSSYSALHIGHKDECIEETVNTKVLVFYKLITTHIGRTILNKLFLS